jgi:hypothetical protein
MNILLFIICLFVVCLSFNDAVRIENMNVGTSIINEYGAVGGMRTARRNRSTVTKPAPSDTFSTTNPN